MKKKRLMEFFPIGNKLRKMFLIMKLCVVLIVFVQGVSASVLAQSTLTIEKDVISYGELFEQIRKQTGYTVIYSNNELNNKELVKANFKNSNLEKVLEEILKGTTLAYELQDEFVILKVKNQQQQQQQTMTITGQVIDNTKKGLPGVTILLKGGTGLGAATDIDGKFTFKIPVTENPVLVFSFIGMKSVEVTYTGKPLTVMMEEDETALEDVVVTGFFERKTESFTGSVATYKGEDLKRVGAQNVLQSLKTLDPSFRITPNNLFGSDPNKLPDINIRGKSSISNIESEWGDDPNRPLFILDGFETDLQTIIDLSMDRIASVNILKDAASTAMYGSKAANGVMVIETIKPQPGELQFSYNGVLTIDAPDLRDYNLMNAREKLAFEQAAGRYEQGSLVSDRLDWAKLYNKRLADVESGVDSYWLSEGVRTGITHKHNIMATGGDNTMYYSLGVNYSGQQGVMEDSKRNLFGGSIKLEYRKGKFQVSNNFSVDYSEAENPSVSFSEYARTNPYYKKEINPEHPEYLEVYQIGAYTYRRSNPLYNASLSSYNETRSLNFKNNLQVNYRPMEGLKITGKLSVSRSDSRTEVLKSPDHTDYYETIETEKGSFKKSTSQNTTYNGDLSVTYAKILNNVHEFNFVARGEFKSTKRFSDAYSAIGIASDKMAHPTFIQSYPESGSPTYSENLARSLNFMATFGYSYDRRYLIDATIRRDGSTNFGSNNLWTNTWSVGVAWNIHNEDFIGDWANMLRIRAAYGNPGNNNQSYDTYLSYSYKASSQNLFGLAAQVSSFGNKNLDWQKTKDLTIGADVSILNRRFSTSLDYYRKVTDPLIISIAVAPSTGKGSYITNVGRNTIQGFTFDLKGTVINDKANDLMVNLSLNGYHEVSEYSRIGNRLNVFNNDLITSSSLYRYRDGASSSDIWTVPSAGIDPMTGKEIFINKDGSYTFKYDANQEVVCGNTIADLEGTVGASVFWKGLSASVYLRYSVGGDHFNNELYERIENIGLESDKYNQDKRAYYDRWKKPGDYAKYRNIRDTDKQRKSSRYVQKNNFLTGESITIGYRFSNQEWVKRMGFSGISANATMNEFFRKSTVKAERGTEYPFARNITFSLNVSF